MAAGKIDREVPNVMGYMVALGQIVGGEIQIDLVPFNHFAVLVKPKVDPEYIPMLLAGDNVSHIRATDLDGFLGLEMETDNRKDRLEMEQRLIEKVEEENIQLPEDEDEEPGEEDEDEEPGDDEPVRVRPKRK